MNTSFLLDMYDQLNQSLKLIETELKQCDWRHLANRGYTIPAILAYRHQHPGTGLKEAKDIVDAFKVLIQ